MSDQDPSAVELNGPFNAIRMVGEVGGIEKTIYIFFDEHLGVQYQTECSNVFSADIDKYLANTFNNLNDSEKSYDFFLEINPSIITYPSDNNRDIYIIQVIKMFKKMFQYQPSNNKVSVSQIFQNVRLHYMDIRDYLEVGYYDRLYRTKDIANEMFHNQIIEIDKLDRIISLIDDFSKHNKVVLQILKESSKNNNKEKVKLIPVKNYMDTAKIYQKVQYILNKTFNRYKHPDIQKKMVNQKIVLQDYLKDLIDNCNDLIDKFRSFINRVLDAEGKLNPDRSFITEYVPDLPSREVSEILYQIRRDVSDLLNKSSFFYTRFMDVYFLRRFLDKDYITNAITYTGAYHSNVYIEILAKEFDFEITHFSYSNTPNLKSLNNKIKKLDANELGQIFYRAKKLQCTDLSHFPEKFS